MKLGVMLRITTQSDVAGTTLVVEGRLAGPWVQEAERCWQEAVVNAQRPVQVRLAAVTFVDEAGRALLAEMHRCGAALAAVGCMTNSIIEEIKREAIKRGERL
jgi:ABC-type transporter Mla MlaB component